MVRGQTVSRFQTVYRKRNDIGGQRTLVNSKGLASEKMGFLLVTRLSLRKDSWHLGREVRDHDLVESDGTCYNVSAWSLLFLLLRQ